MAAEPDEPDAELPDRDRDRILPWWLTAVAICGGVGGAVAAVVIVLRIAGVIP